MFASKLLSIFIRELSIIIYCRRNRGRLSCGIGCQKAYNSINMPENSFFYIVDC